MKILLTGASGQVGFELSRALHGAGEIFAPSRQQMDLADLSQVREVIQRFQPDVIINPGAYTAVDKAEAEPDIAMLINAHAPAVMAEEARKTGAVMVHYSTDYVFDGSKESAYVEEDIPSPCNVYGESKLAGEQAIIASGIDYLILRTSWVYSLRGHNFVLTMLRLAQQRNEVRIVADQKGAPTWSRTIASTTVSMLPRFVSDERSALSGIYHLTAQGVTTWSGFAEAIFDRALPEHKIIVHPIASSEYPTLAMRPKNSVMSCQKLVSEFCALPAWKDALTDCLSEAKFA